MAKTSKQPGGLQNVGHLGGPVGPGGIPGQRPPPPGEGGVLPKGRLAPAQEAGAVVGGVHQLGNQVGYVRVHHRHNGLAGGEVLVDADGGHVAARPVPQRYK